MHSIHFLDIWATSSCVQAQNRVKDAAGVANGHVESGMLYFL